MYLVENPIYPPWAVFLFPAFAIVDILLFITISNVCIQRGLVRESPIYLGLSMHVPFTSSKPAKDTFSSRPFLEHEETSNCKILLFPSYQVSK